MTRTAASCALAHLMLAASLCPPAASTTVPIPLSASGVAHTFTGNGGLSAGASSRLLQDYPAAIRADVLDMLFLPQHGLGLDIIKVEIGGDAQSTDGTEPSHEHFRGDLSCTRGYELDIMREARARNPAILTYGLSWGAPGWIGNQSGFFSQEMMRYQTAWLTCMRSEGVEVDFIGVWNERFWGGPDYVVGLRDTMDAAGFNSTRIIIPDGGYDPTIMETAATNPLFNKSFDGVGLHYPCEKVHPEVQAGGKLYWASEDWWAQPSWLGAQTWGHILAHNYVSNSMTSTIAWSPLWSVYSALPDEQAGLILAAEPWSGHWEVSLPIWVGAQWSQFVSPGWRFLSVASGGSGLLPTGGTYISLVPPKGSPPGLTLIIETFVDSARCKGAAPSAPQTLTFAVAGGAPLPPPLTPLSVWQTTEAAPFIQLPDVIIGSDGTFSVTVLVDAIITLSTTRGARKGEPATPIPPASPFPLPYADSFSRSTYPLDDVLARYFADQYGSFAVREGQLVQVAPMHPGVNAWVEGEADPLTVLGDPTWDDVSVAVSVIMPATLRLADGDPALLAPCAPASPYQMWSVNTSGPLYISNRGGSGGECLNVYGCEDKVVLWACVTTGGSCCGDDCYEGLQWQLDATTGALRTALPASTCVTASDTSANATLTMAPCVAASPLQTWRRDSASGLIQLGATGLCLSQASPPPPPPPYAQVCGRVGPVNGFAGKVVSGYCLRIAADGGWSLMAAASTLASGNLSPLPPPGSSVALNLTLVGTAITARVDGATLAAVEDGSHTAGFAALGCSANEQAFGLFAVTAAR